MDLAQFGKLAVAVQHGAISLIPQEGVPKILYRMDRHGMKSIFCNDSSGGVLNLSFHPQISDRFSRIQLTDCLLGGMRGGPGDWKINCRCVAAFWQTKTGPAA